MFRYQYLRRASQSYYENHSQSMFTVSSLLENYSHCLESLRISDFAPLKLGVDCQYLAEPADPVSCDTSQASLLGNITPGIKFPPSARPDLSLCEKSL